MAAKDLQLLVRQLMIEEKVSTVVLIQLHLTLVLVWEVNWAVKQLDQHSQVVTILRTQALQLSHLLIVEHIACMLIHEVVVFLAEELNSDWVGVFICALSPIIITVVMRELCVCFLPLRVSSQASPQLMRQDGQPSRSFLHRRRAARTGTVDHRQFGNLRLTTWKIQYDEHLKIRHEYLLKLGSVCPTSHRFLLLAVTSDLALARLENPRSGFEAWR